MVVADTKLTAPGSRHGEVHENEIRTALVIRVAGEAGEGIKKPGELLIEQNGTDNDIHMIFAGSVDVPELRQPKAPELRWLGRKPLRPGNAELMENPRSRSAKLRAAARIGVAA